MEAESNINIGHGFNVYLNGTMGAAKYQQTKLWVANAPRNTETVGLTYQFRNWDSGFFNKRVGPMFNDNGAFNQAIAIDPFHLTNAFVNYTVKGSTALRGTKLRLSVNNVFDQHNIVGVSAATAGPHPAPAPGDTLTLLPGRSVMLTVTFGWAPAR